MKTPIEKSIVDRLIADLGINDFAKATIREVKQVAAKAEQASGVEFIKMEMGIPGLPAAQVGVDAQVKALREGIAHSYPDIQGAPVLKQEASRFVKAFIGVDIAPEGCVPVTGSMQGTFASFLTCSQCDPQKDTVLFIDPGFPVQKMQLQVMGVKKATFDVYDYRGEVRSSRAICRRATSAPSSTRTRTTPRGSVSTRTSCAPSASSPPATMRS